MIDQPQGLGANKALNIGIVNAWGSNRGDEAMLSSLLHYLKSLDMNVQTTVYVNNRVDLKRFANVETKPWLKLDRLFPKTPKKIRQMRGLIGLLFPPALQPQAQQFFAHDFVISSPAGPYLGDLKPQSEWLCLLQLAICNSNRVPFGILATSAGPFLNQRRNIIRKAILKNAAFWTVREPVSLSHLSELPIQIDKSMGSDLVFAHPSSSLGEFLAPTELDKFNAVLKKLEEKPFIVVVLNKTSFFDVDGNVVPFDPSSYIPKMGGLLKHAIDKTGCKLLIIPHFYGDSLEEYLTKKIAEFTQKTDWIEVLDSGYNAEAQMYLYKQAEFAISHRYHPTIFAAKAECPFLCIRHQFKVDGMLQMFDNPGPVANTTDSVEKWIEAFDEAWRCRDQIKAQIQAHLPNVINLSLKHLEILGNHLRKVQK
ncbi:polysaccharide pyruvyl transferase family protein [Phormidium sp. CCY1219]|uniref:polysaccharide pyruvyl transferase family protein n=1 Tax=Phormidium sp. CCY1219 TaxID=2886104 RepID=UPI002D1EF559|nr:polysaccharide pyruvyl transferase family protein [Phormidium sp. CCY1219]MEB3827945.1 polysaccharide pyruvyl transferase family protein [Phormidium sp. CCY1219]